MTDYLGWTIATPGLNTGGPCLVRALNVCEALELHDRPPREVDGATMFAEMQADAFAWAPVLWTDPDRPSSDVAAALEAALSKADGQRVAALIAAGVTAGAAPSNPGTHGAAVIDADGTVVCGSHSTTSRAWGSGMFVGGVSLNVASHMLADRTTSPGGRTLRASLGGVIASRGTDLLGLTATNAPLSVVLQNLIDTIGYGHSIDVAVGRPRWGGAAFDILTGTNTAHLHCELRIPDAVAGETTRLGQPVVRADATGLGYVLAVAHQSGSRRGAADPRFRGMSFAG